MELEKSIYTRNTFQNLSLVGMTSEVYKVTEEELLFLGDILCVGIIKKGLSKVGSSPDTATAMEMKKAMEVHIGPALISFVGPSESQKILSKIRSKIEKLQPKKGAAS